MVLEELEKYLGNDLDGLEGKVMNAVLEKLRRLNDYTTTNFWLPIVDYLFLSHWLTNTSFRDLENESRNLEKGCGIENPMGVKRSTLSRIFDRYKLPKREHPEAVKIGLEKVRAATSRNYRLSQQLQCEYSVIGDIIQRTLEIIEKREGSLCRWRPDEIYPEDQEFLLEVYDTLRELGMPLNGSYIKWFAMTGGMNEHYDGVVCYLEGSSGNPSKNGTNQPTIENNAFAAEYKPYSFQ